MYGLSKASFRIAGPVSVLVTGIAIESVGLSTTLLALTVGTALVALAVAVDPAIVRMDHRPERVDVPAERDL